MRGQSYSNKKNNSNKEDFQGGETKVMKKSLKMLLVFALVFSMFAPAIGFAAEAEMDAQAKFDAMVEAGILEGIDGEAALDKNMQRNEVAKILANIFELEVVAGAPTPFPDEPADNWGYTDGYIQAVVKSGLMIGGEKADGTIGFRPSAQLDVQELAVVLDRALDLPAGDEVEGKTSSWATAAVAAVVADGLLPASADYTVDATRADLVSSTYAVYVYVEELKAAEEAAKALNVVSVSADNLKEITIEFNREVDATTAVNANFSVNNSVNNLVDTTAQLQEDGMTVVLTATTQLDNQVKYTVTVDKVATASGNVIEKTETEFTAFDATLPTLEESVVTGPNSLELQFSEPIKENGSVSVKSGDTVIGVNPTFAGYGTTNISVQLFTSMVDGSKYEVTVQNFDDYAGYKNVIKTVELDYAKDATAPTATVSKVEQEYVVVDFNKPVSGLTKEHFSHSFTAWKSVKITSDSNGLNAIGTTDKVSTVYVWFHAVDGSGVEDPLNRPVPEGTVSFVVSAKVGSNEIKDNWGNKFAENVFSLTVTADRTVPAVTELKVDTESSLEVTFNKNVNFDQDNVEILNADGSDIAGVNVTVDRVDGSQKVYTINFGTNLSGETILVNIEDVEDVTLAGNKLTLHSETLTVTDKTVASITNIYKSPITATDDRALYVFFSEAVSATALDKANYKFKTGLGYVSVTGAPSFFTSNKIVKIPLTEAQLDNVNDNTYEAIFVSGVEDVAGNKIVGQEYASTIQSITTVTPALATTNGVKVTAADKLVLTFDAFLPIVDMGVFRVNGFAPAGMTVGTTASGNTVVTLTTHADHKFKADLSETIALGAVSYEILTSTDTVRVKNVFDIAVVGTTELPLGTGNDKIAPTVTSAVYNDLAGTITITFSETLDASTFALSGNNGFSVNGGTLSDVDLAVNQIILTGSDFTVNTDIIYNGTNIKDAANGNTLATFTRTQKLVLP